MKTEKLYLEKYHFAPHDKVVCTEVTSDWKKHPAKIDRAGNIFRAQGGTMAWQWRDQTACTFLVNQMWRRWNQQASITWVPLGYQM